MDDTTFPSMPVAELALPGEARSAREARHFLATTLTGWKSLRYRDDAALVLSELVTNAALHARTDLVVHVKLQADCLRVAVTDGSPRQPVVRHYSDSSTTGRGLSLVSALAQRWGIEPHPDGGKTVWAEVGSNEDPGTRSEGESGFESSTFPNLAGTDPVSGSGPGCLLAA